MYSYFYFYQKILVVPSVLFCRVYQALQSPLQKHKTRKNQISV